jgi:hypothetical protein
VVGGRLAVGGCRLAVAAGWRGVRGERADGLRVDLWIRAATEDNLARGGAHEARVRA